MALFDFAVPSSPTIVSAVGHLNPRGFTVSYRELECREINADEGVRDYIIRYGLVSSRQDQLKSTVAGTNPFTIVDPSFTSLVSYQFQLAAVNSKAMGAFSSPVQAAILEGENCDTPS